MMLQVKQVPSIQNIVGNETEKQVAELFHKNEYWAFVIPKKIGGQPFDIIASREKDTWFVDAKHLEASKASFPFDRIEANQITSMNYAYKFANITENLGFAIKWDRTDTIYFFSYKYFCELKSQGKKSVKMDCLIELEYRIRGW